MIPRVLVSPRHFRISTAWCHSWYRLEAMRGRGADASLVLYPGAVHYFDVRGQARTFLAEVENRNKPGGCCGATVGYDPAADADARGRIEAFFAHHLGAR